MQNFETFSSKITYIIPSANFVKIFLLFILACLRNIESLMSCHLLLNLLHELPTNVINLVINDNEFEILFIT